ncbi:MULTISPECIES: hypothetical protein [unclassified Nostoc]|uniref:hypothetical protein n=1 Tax=unclassified Nostoc TaxID=2593658 RepID=UPI0025AB03D9|nr:MULTISPECIES: hypothetical protein [unclassified Nostoc]MDM9581885.1 hypothetical protein [Nostoc sp. GT001]MDZ7946423.1 hypothetical protein [Nostoc sp. EfeVER01]MDZ7994731.1 hypothetical protein [Nostoc sp. EspVER01]
MLKQTENVRIKIFRSIFAAVNLALISGGLVSCVIEAPQPPAPTEQQKPVVQPNQNDRDDDKDDDDKDGDRKNDKKDDDKDDND